jgi:hypothetical protein
MTSPPSQNKIGLHIQNCILLVLCLASIYGSIQFYITNTQVFYHQIHPFVVGFFVVDFFYNPLITMKIHHLCIASSMVSSSYLGIAESDNNMIIDTLYRTEISTIFMIMRYYLPKNTAVYQINNIIFYLLFFKLRIIDFYDNIIQPNSQLYAITVPDGYYGGYVVILLGNYGLFALNIYWFSILTSMLYKICFPNKSASIPPYDLECKIE